MVDNLCGAFALAHLELQGKSLSGTARRAVYISVSKSLFWKEECLLGHRYLYLAMKTAQIRASHLI